MTRALTPAEARTKGADKKNPQRYRKDYVAATLPVGDAPPHLSEGAQSVWFEMTSLAPDEVLKAPDRGVLSIYCELEAQRRSAPKEFTAALYAQTLRCLSMMGMSPVDRLRLATPKAKEQKKDDFEDF